MAYMNQEKKQKIQAELKKVIPSDWKWSLSVRQHMAICLTIWQGPAELMVLGDGSTAEDHRTVNEYHIDNAFKDSKMVEIFRKINRALNLDNFDNSDPMTDYFHVGHYVDIEIGRYNKPFVAIETEPVTVEADPVVEFINGMDMEPADLAADFFHQSATEPTTADPIVETEPESVTVATEPKQAKKRTRKPAAKKQPKQAKTIKGKARAAAVKILTGWLARLQA